MKSEWLRLRSARAMLVGSTARKSLAAVSSQALMSATNFSESLLIARLCTKEEFGAYTLAFSFLLVANGLQSALITTPMNVIGAPLKATGWREYLGTMALGQAALGTILTVLSGAAAAVVSILMPGAGALGGALWGLTAAVLFSLGREFCRRALLTRLRSAAVLTNDLFCCAVELGAVAGLWLLGGGTWGTGGMHASPGFLSAGGVLLCTAGGELAAWVLGLWQLHGDALPRRIVAREHLPATWRYARWTLANFITMSIFVHANVWVLAAIGGVESLGTMEAPRLIVAPLQILTMGAPGVLIPLATRQYAAGGMPALRGFVRRLAPVWLLLLVAYAAMVAAAPHFWLGLCFGGRYAGATSIVYLWLMVHVAMGVNILMGLPLQALRRPDVSTKARTVTCVLSIGLTAILAPIFGAAGAVVSRLAGLVANGLAISYVSTKWFKTETGAPAVSSQAFGVQTEKPS